MSRKILYNGELVNEGSSWTGYVVIDGNTIEKVGKGAPTVELLAGCDERIDVDGAWIFPGVIDDQVHFRDPGLTHKADIETESAAAVAGGVTSFMDMPNTQPPTTTIDALQAKWQRASEVSLANYGFFIGATNDNLNTLLSIDYTFTPGVKLFLGASTGNMLVNDKNTLKGIFSEVPALIAIHSEDEMLIRRNRDFYVSKFGEDLPIQYHQLIRSTEVCYKSTARAVEMAHKYNTRLHVLHLSTARELELFGRYEENAYMRRMMLLVGHTQTTLYEIGGHDHGAMGDPAFHILHPHVKKILEALPADTAQTVSILGDSYSTFYGHVTPRTNLCWYGVPGEKKENDVTTLEQTWWQLLLHRYGYRLDTNNSYSGATVCYTGYNGEDYSDRAFITRMADLGNPDIILLFGGTNDSWAGSPLGHYQYADWQKDDFYDFRPAFSYLLDYLITHYPHARIYNITNTELSDPVTQSMDRICRHYGVTNIRLHDIDKQWGHPSVKGMESICRQVGDVLSAAR